MTTEIHGAGDPVLMVHGLGGTSNVFGPQVGVLQRFFRCVRPDLPGSGRSPTPSLPVGGMSLIDVTDALAALIESEGGGKWHVVGHSLGTVLCQHLAVRRPDLVRSLALIGPILAPGDPVRAALRDRGAKARAEGMTGIAEAIVQGGTSARTKAERPEIAAFVREILMRQDPDGYALTCEALAGIDAANIDAIAVPTLVLTGDEDGTSPPRAAKAIADRIAGSSFEVLDRCGHWTTFEQPNAVNAALLNFLLNVK